MLSSPRYDSKLFTITSKDSVLKYLRCGSSHDPLRNGMADEASSV